MMHVGIPLVICMHGEYKKQLRVICEFSFVRKEIIRVGQVV